MDLDLKSDYHAKKYPDMTTREEQQLYRSLAGKLTGAGCVVDLGTWMGSTTEALARGLTQPDVLIHAYDRYIWEAWMEKSYPGHYKPGDSFLEEYKARISPWRDRIVVHAGDLTKEKWWGPIELLLVDAMKSLDLANAIKQQFFGSLVPGAYLVHQDFFHYFTAWIHPIQYRLREYFAPEGDTNSSYVFRCIKTPPDYALSPIDFDSFADDELHAAFTWSRRLASKSWQRMQIELARRCWQLHKDMAHKVPGAEEELREIMKVLFNQSF